jgi:hypothetical protein
LGQLGAEVAPAEYNTRQAVAWFRLCSEAHAIEQWGIKHTCVVMNT